VTLNRHTFIGLHQNRPGHAGIIVCTFDLDFAALAQRIHQAIADSSTIGTARSGESSPLSRAVTIGSIEDDRQH
jgi:hypothetical protein